MRGRVPPAAVPCLLSPPSITISTSFGFLHVSVFLVVCKWVQVRVQATAAFDQCNMWEMEHFRNADSKVGSR